jgi:cytochrome c oxidase assembly factor CtaG
MSPVLAHWSAVWPVLVIYLAVAGAHLAGTLRGGLGGPGGRRAVISEAALFQGGLLLALLAIVSPLRYWSGIYIWVRAIQDLALAIVAPGLIVVGAPWPALARSVGRRQIGQRAPDGPAAGPRRPWWLRWPLATVVAFNVIWLGWHLPALFDRVPVSTAAAAGEHVLYLGAGILFWLQLIGSRPWTPAAAPMRRTALLVGTVAADTILGMVLVFGSGVFYRYYGNASHHVMTVVDDQQLAGAILWMGALPPLIAASVAVLVRWLNDEESADLSAGIDRLLTQRSSAWPSRPRFR